MGDFSALEGFGGYPANPIGFHVGSVERSSMRVEAAIRRSVLYVGVKSPTGTFTPVGTAFMFTVEIEGKRFDHAVTALHNIEMIQNGRGCLRVNIKGGTSTLIDFNNDDWFTHPAHTDKKYIDVAVWPTQGPGGNFDLAVMDESLAATKEIIANLKILEGEPIITVGLFTSHYGEERNVPIVRVGNIAALANPAEPVWTSKGYMEAHLVEVRSLGGLSGSPVFVQIAPHRIVDGKIRDSGGAKVAYLLGVMRGHFNVKEPIDVAAGETADTMNAGIGVVVPYEKIKETINHPVLIRSRENILKELKRKRGDVEDSAKAPPPPAQTNNDANPDHKEDFTRLLGAAVKTNKQAD